MTKTIIGDRPLSSITEEELAVFLDMTGEYGHKDYWGEPVITHIDREHHENAITVWFTQTRVSDGETSDNYIELNLNTLTYHVSHFYPYDRMSPTKSVLQKPKIFIWMLRQGFDVPELLNEDSYIDDVNGYSRRAMGYVIADISPWRKELKKDENGEVIFYDSDQHHDAVIEHRKMVEADEYTEFKLYELVEVKEGKKHRMSKCEAKEQ